MVKKSSSNKSKWTKILPDMEIDASKNPELQLEELTRSIQANDLDGRVGWVMFAGRVADGTTRVQFNVNNDGWSSEWPEWAFALAQLALVHSLRLWVISRGVPWGVNLVQEHVLHLNG